MYKVDEVHNLFCDAIVKDQFGVALFVSLIGNDSSIFELAGRLSLPSSQKESLQFITFRKGDDEIKCNATALSDKLAQRLPEHAGFQGLHVFWSSKKIKPQFRDEGKGYAFAKSDMGDDEFKAKVWAVVKDCSRIPFLEHWRDEILDDFYTFEWIKPLECYGDVKAHAIELVFDDLANYINEKVRSKAFSLSH